MKQIWLIAFFYVLTGCLFAQEAPELNLGLNYKSTNLSFSVSSNLQQELYSFSLGSFSNKAFPVQLKGGNLTYSGSYSSLVNPSLSSVVSPFTFTDTQTDFLTITPSANLKPFSITAAYEFSNRQTILQKANLYAVYVPAKTFSDSTLFVSSSSLIKPNVKTKISFTFSAGFFPLEENDFSTWYNLLQYYPKTSQLAAQVQLGMEHKIKENIIISEITEIKAYEQPLQNINFILNQDFSLKLKRTNMWTKLSFNPNTTVTATKKLDPYFQIKSGINKTFPSSLGLCTLGSSLFYSKDFYSSKDTIKEAAGIKFTNTNFSSSLSLNLNQEISTGSLNFNSFSLGLKANINIKDFKPQTSFNFYYEPKNNSTEEKLSLGINFYNHFSMNFSSSIDFVQKEGVLTKADYDFSFYSKWYLKKISCTCKLSAAFKFL